MSITTPTARPEIVVEPAPDDRATLVTVVVPTFNEKDSVHALVRRVVAAVGHLPVEILFVDDSTDATPDAIRAVAGTSVPVRLLHRPAGQRTGGLGGAVLAGLRSTDAQWAVVMDGDLQHPPETLPALINRAIATGADVVVASRYTEGGSAEGLADSRRRWVSSLAGLLAYLAFPQRLRRCTDPMSGFFLLHRGAVNLDRLAPDGFKILLEILCRGDSLSVAEVPFRFRERLAGESKAGLRQGFVYLRHLLRLRLSGQLGHLAGFLAVGATGIVPNLLTVALLAHLGLNYLLTTAVATVVAASSNFLLTDLLLFRQRRTGRMRHRWLGYVGLSAADIALRVPLVALLVEVGGHHLMGATVVSIVVAGIARFAVLNRWFYRGAPRAAANSHLLLAEAVRGAR